jgi:predicted TIM-barrel fold metal-dependent hydrolase
VLWAGVDRGLPVQLHTGFGDPDLNLRRADPLLAMDFLASLSGAGVQVVLLHCYPFHRNGAFLAQAYPHVYLDLGLTINYAGARAAAVLAEALELAPFAKVLYSSDAFGLPELVYLGARLWRNAMAEILGGWIAAGHWVEADAIRVARLIGAANAVRLYGLPEIG